MFSRKTVFIIGAGCSYEYGLPVGNGLRDQIVAMMGRLPNKSDPIFAEAIQILAEDQDDGVKAEWINAAAEIARGIVHSSSIDRYLNLRQDNGRIVQIGKLAVVQSIAYAEASSSLALRDGSLDFNAIRRGASPDWLSQIFLQMQEGCSRDTFSDAFRNITFVCFNYDRCIEHYFYHAVKDICAFTEAETSDVLRDLRILHPYGRIGIPSWEKGNPSLRLDYGMPIADGTTLIALSQGIKTFTEKLEEGEELDAIHRDVIDADRIVFCGFSFLDQNMELLTPKVRTKATESFATTFGESDSNREIANFLIKKMMLGGRTDIDVSKQPRLLPNHISAGRFFGDDGNMLKR